jgi:hypothetical protein
MASSPRACIGLRSRSRVYFKREAIFRSTYKPREIDSQNIDMNRDVDLTSSD